jgi:hypothetical protein
MTPQDLEQLRRDKWHLNAQPVRTLEDARAFIEANGFCMQYPQRPEILAPTFVGAWVGSDDRLPTWQQAFADSRAHDASELMVRLLRERDAYEANLSDENNGLLIAASIFPYYYALAGERNPRQAPKPGPRAEFSQLACDMFEIIKREGPISKQQLLQKLGGGASLAAVDKSTAELWSKLRITRVDYDPREGSSWDLLYRWAPEPVREGIGLSVPEALSALLSKYLDCVIAAEQSEVEAFFGHVVPRSRVKDAIHALLALGELQFVPVGNRSLIQITPAKTPISRDSTSRAATK